MTTHSTDKLDFGEPWIPQNQGDHLWIALREGSNIVGDIVCDAPGAEYSGSLAHWPERAQRILACVNACAGMNDPATKIQAMREAIKEAEHILSYYRKFAPALSGLPEDIWLETADGRQVVSSLAKLKPLLNP